jgi:hypothetical protein
VPGFEAFFELKTRADLVEKLRHDLSRIRQNQTDSYAAFDFFVTAEAMMDWRYPGLGGKPEQERGVRRNSEALLRVTSHLATGAKHFKVQAKLHTSVDNISEDPGFFDPALFDPAFFDTGCLVVYLKGKDAQALGRKITVLALAERVLQYWEDDVKSQ